MEPMQEAKQMTTAQAVGAASHTPGECFHRRAVVYRKRAHFQLGHDEERAKVILETGEVYSRMTKWRGSTTTNPRLSRIGLASR
jgi:hypothetical protein